ncbi:MAG: response regulator [Candidatus Cloacimonetes bacterium]|nr:response regulator [Candidatus Cloacimonadota bacterium]
MKQLLLITKEKNNQIGKLAILSKVHGDLHTTIFELIDKTNQDLIKSINQNNWDIILYDSDYLNETSNDFEKDFPSYLRSNITGSTPYIVSFSNIEGAGFSTPSADNYISFPIVPSIFKSVIYRALGKSLRVLVVEDSKTQRIILRQFIKERGYEVLEAENGKEALDIIDSECPDIIISDIEMPEMDGFELTQYLSQHKRLKRVPILIVSSLSNSSAIKNALQKGAVDYVTKPYDVDKIHQKISHYTAKFSKNRKTILVVDDSPLIIKLISMTLHTERYKVISASNGKEGIELALKIKPDIITTDYNMPEMDGWEFCRKLKDNESTKDIPIIMITSKSTDLDKKIGRALKVYDYITKPFTSESLLSTINTALIEQLAEKVRKEKDHLSQEMKIGNQVQQQILSDIHVSNQQISAKSGWIPCKELSGDFYDLIECSDNNHLAIIGDVSGKGLPASLVTVASQACLRGQTMHNQSTGQLLHGLNQYLCISTKDEMFLTCFIAKIDHENKFLQYSSAGHNEMILFKKTSNEIIDLSANGLPCGMFDECEYDTKQVSYDKGDILILYTDGVTEAELNKSQYGIERLYETIKEHGPSSNSIELNQKILDSVKGFVSSYPQSDDITLLLVDLL